VQSSTSAGSVGIFIVPLARCCDREVRNLDLVPEQDSSSAITSSGLFRISFQGVFLTFKWWQAIFCYKNRKVFTVLFLLARNAFFATMGQRLLIP